MFILFLLIVLLYAVLTAFLTFWTQFLQGYIYTEPTSGLGWRGPAAGGAMTVVLLLWLVCDYMVPGGYRPLWEFSSTEDSAPFPELRVPTAQGEEVYKLRPGTRNEYHLGGRTAAKALKGRPSEVIVVEGDKRSTFKPEQDEQGHFKQRTTTSFGYTSKDKLRYLDENGRVMYEDSLGQLTVVRGGRFVGNVLLNLLFFAACFLSMWFVLRFQWPHALGQAVVVWAVVLLFLWPPILAQAEAASRARAAASGATLWLRPGSFAAG